MADDFLQITFKEILKTNHWLEDFTKNIMEMKNFCI